MDSRVTTISPPSSRSVSPSSPPSCLTTLLPAVVVTPCAACKILRRRCAEKCVLAPYFPPNDPIKFTTAHRVFGASNIIKFLQELQEDQRADAVSSMVYEANARLRDPVYGCAGTIDQLQKQVNFLQAQLAKAQAEVANLHYQNNSLLSLYYEMAARSSPQASSPPQQFYSDDFSGQNGGGYPDDIYCLSSVWDQLNTLDMTE